MTLSSHDDEPSVTFQSRARSWRHLGREGADRPSDPRWGNPFTARSPAAGGRRGVPARLLASDLSRLPTRTGVAKLVAASDGRADQVSRKFHSSPMTQRNAERWPCRYPDSHSEYAPRFSSPYVCTTRFRLSETTMPRAVRAAGAVLGVLVRGENA